MSDARDRRRNDKPVDVDRRRAERNRRIHERVMVDLEVDYRASDTFLFAYITDISAMGIFVRTNTPEPEGTRINLCFRTPKELGSRPMELEGEVIWINRYRPNDPEGRQPGMGLRFVDLTPPQREEVMRLVRTFAYLSDDDDQDERDLPVGNS